MTEAPLDDQPRSAAVSKEPLSLAEAFAPRVLIVDDEPLLLKTMKALLEINGFDCRTAEDGFDALRHLRETPPEILVSDLRMPNMSGFELLAIIRRRFPQIAVVVISGEFRIEPQHSGLLMNAFFRKGGYAPQELIATIRDLYSQCPMRPALPKATNAPLWINCRNCDYLLATCTECLRSFPIDSHVPTGEALQTTDCPSCGTTITYAVDSSVLEMLEAQKAASNPGPGSCEPSNETKSGPPELALR